MSKSSPSGTAFETALILALLAIVLIVCSLPVSSQSIPCMVMGTVTLDGSPISGAQVSCSDGQSFTSGSGGFYSFTVNSGDKYTITASYNGHSGSAQIQASGAKVIANIGISSASTHCKTNRPYGYDRPDPDSCPARYLYYPGTGR